MRARYARLVLLLCLSIALTACQSLRTAPGEQSAWRLKARVAIKTPDESVAATLIWQQNSASSDFHLFGALGATYVRVRENGDGALLELPDEQTFNGSDAEQVIYQALGWEFPLHALRFWVLGEPAGLTDEVASYDDARQLQAIDYGQWHIEFERYSQYSGRNLPRIIRVSHPRLSLKLVVKNWRFG